MDRRNFMQVVMGGTAGLLAGGLDSVSAKRQHLLDMPLPAATVDETNLSGMELYAKTVKAMCDARPSRWANCIRLESKNGPAE